MSRLWQTDNYIYVQESDLHVNPENPAEINTVIQFDLIFEFGDAPIERECFYDFISQDKEDPAKQTIQLHLNSSKKIMERKNISKGLYGVGIMKDSKFLTNLCKKSFIPI